MNKWRLPRTSILLLALALWISKAGAADELYCFDQAAAYYQVPEILIRAIAYHESGMNPTLVNVNVGGSRDIGLMQINEWWLPKIRKLGIQEKDLYDPCVSIFVGTWVLAQNMQQTDDVWEAVGAYNAGWSKEPEREKRRKKYVQRIKRQVARLQDEQQRRMAREANL